MNDKINRFFFIGLTFSLFLLLPSCAYKIPTHSFACCESPSELIQCNREEALNHWLYTIIPRHRSQIYWYDIGHWTTWMVFGNDDDGIFGEETSHYHRDWPINVCRATAWELRNPLHNFCFYVIGTAYWENSKFTLIKLTPERFCLCHEGPENGGNFASKNSCFYLGFHGCKPFASLRFRYTPEYHSDFYLGWRCRGNFGIKCNVLTKYRDDCVNE